MKRIARMLVVMLFVCAVNGINACAEKMSMYINDQYVEREMVCIGKFDMLPILDIAGELGYRCIQAGDGVFLYNDEQSFTFTLGSSSVYDHNGKWFGVDVVPQIINGKIMIPAKFIQDNLCLSYTWDPITNTIFIGSDNTYNWLINTKEYKDALYKQKKSNITSWDIDDWCMVFSTPSYLQPTIQGEEVVNVYSYGTNSIKIECYMIGDRVNGYGPIFSANDCITGKAKFYKGLSAQGDGLENYGEVLSESNTTVNGIPARQVTYRNTMYLNRHKTKMDYTIIRSTAFQHGNWVYVIEARQNKYLWDDSFWNIMEIVRNSVSFY